MILVTKTSVLLKIVFKDMEAVVVCFMKMQHRFYANDSEHTGGSAATLCCFVVTVSEI